MLRLIFKQSIETIGCRSYVFKNVAYVLYCNLKAMFFIHPNLTILGRIAALARYGLLTDVLTYRVCVVGHHQELCKTAEPIEMSRCRLGSRLKWAQ